MCCTVCSYSAAKKLQLLYSNENEKTLSCYLCKSTCGRKGQQKNRTHIIIQQRRVKIKANRADSSKKYLGIQSTYVITLAWPECFVWYWNLFRLYIYTLKLEWKGLNKQ